VSGAGRSLVALGDSITCAGEGEAMLGLPFRSWSSWVAGALGLSLVNLASDGATAGVVLAEQVPALPSACAVVTVYVGVNDARSPDWDPAAFERDLRAVLEAAARCSDVVLVGTVPENLGRPTAAPKPLAASAIVRSAAGAAGALVAAFDDLAGIELVLPDQVHVSAAGQVELARRALLALGRDGALPAPDRSPAARRAWRRRYRRLDLRDRARIAREAGAIT
jgi:lysophospholipase L1-like esterase